MQKYLKNYLMWSVSLHWNQVKKNISSFIISKQKILFKNANKKKRCTYKVIRAIINRVNTLLFMPSPQITGTWFQNQPFDLYLMEEAYFHWAFTRKKEKKTKSNQNNHVLSCSKHSHMYCKEQGCTVTPLRARAPTSIL